MMVIGDDDAVHFLHLPDSYVRSAFDGDRAGLPAAVAAAVEQIDAYFAGALTDFSLPLDPAGTDFQRRVWLALADIPYGRDRELRGAGRPGGEPEGLSGRRPGQRPQPHPPRPALPPGHRGQREPHRLRRRPRAQAAPPRPRALVVGGAVGRRRDGPTTRLVGRFVR